MYHRDGEELIATFNIQEGSFDVGGNGVGGRRHGDLGVFCESYFDFELFPSRQIDLEKRGENTQV